MPDATRGSSRTGPGEGFDWRTRASRVGSIGPPGFSIFPLCSRHSASLRAGLRTTAPPALVWGRYPRLPALPAVLKGGLLAGLAPRASLHAGLRTTAPPALWPKNRRSTLRLRAGWRRAPLRSEAKSKARSRCGFKGAHGGGELLDFRGVKRHSRARRAVNSLA